MVSLVTMNIENLANKLHKKYFNKQTNSFSNSIVAIGTNKKNVVIYFSSKEEMSKFKEQDNRITLTYTGPVEVNTL